MPHHSAMAIMEVIILPDCAKDNIRAAFKAAGYRIILEGGSVSSSIRPGGSFCIDIKLEKYWYCSDL